MIENHGSNHEFVSVSYFRISVLLCIGSILGCAPRTEPALHAAAAAGNAKEVARLIKAGADVDQLDDRPETALFAAVLSGSVPTTKVLIESGANLEASKNSGLTPLGLAVKRRDYTMIHLLLSHGAVAGCPGSSTLLYDYPPIHIAERMNDKRLLQLLSENGCKQ